MPEGPQTNEEALFRSAQACFAEGRLGEAENLCREILARRPGHAGALEGLGAICLQGGRPAEAAGYLAQAEAAAPGSPAILDALGMALAKAGQFAQAAEVYEKLAALKPDSVQTLANLGSVLAASGRLEEAFRAYESALTLAPGSAALQQQCGFLLARLERHGEATAYLARAAAAEPGNPAVRNELGMAYSALGRYREAAGEFEAVLKLMPGSEPARLNLAIALKDVGREHMAYGRYRQAAAAFERAAGVMPGYAPAAYGLGDVLNNLNRPEDAKWVFEALLAGNPDDAMAWLGLGDAEKSAGRLAEARAAYEKAVALSPRLTVGHRLLAECARFAEGDPRLAALEALEGEADAVPQKEQADLYFALFKAYDDLGRTSEAFERLAKANALKRAEVTYDEARHLGELKRIAETFTPDFLAQHAGAGEPSEVPVFIFGMPRSGTTLVEQILASHSQVYGGGELTALEVILQSVAEPGDFTFAPASLNDARLREIGCRYLAELRALAPHAARVTDKMTGNYRLAGLIRLALPGARLIHVRRDPLDTCFSCYANSFRRLEFTYDLGELGRDYKAYERMMDHWRVVLPPDAMLEVQYETLVTDFETQARRIVEFCALPWEERCLRFNETARPVGTQSAVQVRRPLYRSAVGRARPYAEWLGPLREALGLVSWFRSSPHSSGQAHGELRNQNDTRIK